MSWTSRNRNRQHNPTGSSDAEDNGPRRQRRGENDQYTVSREPLQIEEEPNGIADDGVIGG